MFAKTGLNEAAARGHQIALIGDQRGPSGQVRRGRDLPGVRRLSSERSEAPRSLIRMGKVRTERHIRTINWIGPIEPNNGQPVGDATMVVRNTALPIGITLSLILRNKPKPRQWAARRPLLPLVAIIVVHSLKPDPASPEQARARAVSNSPGMHRPDSCQGG